MREPRAFMLTELLVDTYHRCPATLAVADTHQSLTYKQLTLLASVLRNLFLRETGCPRVGLMLPASSIFPAALFGALWSGKTAVPLNFLLHAEELARVVEDAGLDLVLTIHHFDELSAKLPARSVFLEDLPLRRRVALAMLRRLPPRPNVDPDATAVLLYTSGTTAGPKGVELTYNNLYTNCIDTIDSLKFEPGHRFLNILPPFHVFGLTANVLIPIVLGASVHAIPRFSPVAVLKTVAEQKISIMLAIPSMYAALLKTKSGTPDTFRSIYLAVSGGEPLPEGVHAGFEKRFGVVLRQGYGLTETSPVVAVCSADNYRKGTVGRPIRNVRLRIVDADGRDVAAGQGGEILIQGPGVMKGYFGKPDETEKVLSDDGWFSTGDVGRIDSDGYLAVTGRAKEMLIIGGENVFPREIEAVLETHEAVMQVAVIGVPDDLRGQAPIAFVIPHSGVEVSQQQLRSHARQALAGFKVPKQVIIRDDLPTGPTGKILKRRLPELL